MIRIRPFAPAVLCFVTAWAVASFISRRNGIAPAPPPPLGPHAALRHDAPKAASGAATLADLTKQLQALPIAGWAAAWDRYASQATCDELLAAGRTGRPGELLPTLAREELVLRTGKMAAPTPEAIATLAELDPAAAWCALEQNNTASMADAALRVLTRSDPAGTLQRILTMPVPAAESDNYNSAPAMPHIGAIFNAWARVDPTAAMTAVGKLPAAQQTIALDAALTTWSYRDGPPALLYALNHKEFRTSRSQRSSCLGASFARHPEATARLMAGQLAQAELCGGYMDGRTIRRWFDADRSGALAWLLREDESHFRLPTGKELLRGLANDPDEAAWLIRNLAPAGWKFDHDAYANIYERNPQQALALAAELGLPPQTVTPTAMECAMSDPEKSCDRWLSLLRTHRDPDRAIAELGWTRLIATAVAERAAQVSPAHASELAKFVPAEWFDTAAVGWGRLSKYWPELPTLRARPAPDAELEPKPSHSLGAMQYRHDPAEAANRWACAKPTTRELEEVMKWWVPFDPKGAREWIDRLASDADRPRALWMLAMMDSVYDPQNALALLEEVGGKNFEVDRSPNDFGLLDATPLRGFVGPRPRCLICLRGLLRNGGDWQGWLARMPEPLVSEDPRFRMFGMDGCSSLAEALAIEARLLEALRGEAGK